MSRNGKSKRESSRSSARSDSRMILERYVSPLADVGVTLFVFGLLVWLYVVAIQITHPGWLGAPLARYGVPPFNMRVDDTGLLAFAVAAFGFFVWRLGRRR